MPQSPTAWANWVEIIFPAAYLQPPLYDPSASIADNFGAMGVIIGHEMNPPFTADGGDISARGRIRHWWTPTDSARFADVQARIIRQFDSYTVLDSATHVSGSRTKTFGCEEGEPDGASGQRAGAGVVSATAWCVAHALA